MTIQHSKVEGQLKSTIETSKYPLLMCRSSVSPRQRGENSSPANARASAVTDQPCQVKKIVDHSQQPLAVLAGIQEQLHLLGG